MPRPGASSSRHNRLSMKLPNRFGASRKSKRVARRGSVHHHQVPAVLAEQLTQLLHRHVLLRAGERRRRRSDRTGCPESLVPDRVRSTGPPSRRMCDACRASSRAARRRLRAPDGTRCGVLPRSLTPSACASRLAGSIVKTHTLRPYSAARNAIAAAVVVLPTPPAPQHTTTRFAVSARMAAISRVVGVVLIELPAVQAIPKARRGCRGRCRRRSPAIPAAAPSTRRAAAPSRRAR